MNEIMKPDNEKSFSELFEDSMISIRSGEIVKGKL